MNNSLSTTRSSVDNIPISSRKAIVNRHKYFPARETTKTNVSRPLPVINVEKLLVETPPAFSRPKIDQMPINYNVGKLT